MNEEKITKATMITLCFLIIIAFILIIILGQETIKIKKTLYAQQTNICNKNTLQQCYPKEISTTNIITCKCPNGIIKRLDYQGIEQKW